MLVDYPAKYNGRVIETQSLKWLREITHILTYELGVPKDKAAPLAVREVRSHLERLRTCRSGQQAEPLWQNPDRRESYLSGLYQEAMR